MPTGDWRSAYPGQVSEPAAWSLPRPAAGPDRQTRQAFDDLFTRAVAAGPATLIDYALAAPKWQFLCHLGDRGLVVLHGSGRDDITRFEPRQSNDVRAFGAQRGVYASSDGIWPIFFAVIDRDRYHGTLVNGCLLVGGQRQPRYFFSLDAEALRHRPWRPGTVYLLPRDGFVAEPHDPGRARPTQLVSLQPVVPLARLPVAPADFPFLDQVRGHDEETLRRRSAADPDAFPWLDDPDP